MITQSRDILSYALNNLIHNRDSIGLNYLRKDMKLIKLTNKNINNHNQTINFLLEKISLLEQDIYKQSQAIKMLQKNTIVNIEKSLPTNLISNTNRNYDDNQDNLILDFKNITINCEAIKIHAKSNVDIKGRIISLN